MISKDDIKYLEGLVKVRLTDQEREQYTKEIDSILEYIKEITSINIEEFSNDHEHNNIFREDIVQEAIGHTQKAIQNSPEHIGNLYKVSQVIKQ